MASKTYYPENVWSEIREIQYNITYKVVRNLWFSFRKAM